jgi:hypothetical protein
MKMMKTKGLVVQVAVAAMLLLAVVLSPLSARVVSSQTLTIHAYIPERTVVAIDAQGDAYLETNSNFVHLHVSDTQGFRILSITAR